MCPKDHDLELSVKPIQSHLKKILNTRPNETTLLVNILPPRTKSNIFYTKEKIIHILHIVTLMMPRYIKNLPEMQRSGKL